MPDATKHATGVFTHDSTHTINDIARTGEDARNIDTENATRKIFAIRNMTVILIDEDIDVGETVEIDLDDIAPQEMTLLCASHLEEKFDDFDDAFDHASATMAYETKHERVSGSTTETVAPHIQKIETKIGVMIHTLDIVEKTHEGAPWRTMVTFWPTAVTRIDDEFNTCDFEARWQPWPIRATYEDVDEIPVPNPIIEYQNTHPVTSYEKISDGNFTGQSPIYRITNDRDEKIILFGIDYGARCATDVLPANIAKNLLDLAEPTDTRFLALKYVHAQDNAFLIYPQANENVGFFENEPNNGQQAETQT